MQFNPLENEETSTLRESKSKSMSAVVRPMSLKQVEQLLASREGAVGAGKVAVVGRVVRLKEMAGRTLVTLSDETGVANIIEVQNADQLEEEEYYHFVVYAKMDKEEPVLMSHQSHRLTDYNFIAFHFANVMMALARPTQ
jgi:hypothetical protein